MIESLNKEEVKGVSDKKKDFWSMVQIGVSSCRIQRSEGGQLDYRIGGKESSWVDTWVGVRSGEGASFLGVSEFLLRKNYPESEGGRGRDRILRRVTSCTPAGKES